MFYERSLLHGAFQIVFLAELQPRLFDVSEWSFVLTVQSCDHTHGFDVRDVTDDYVLSVWQKVAPS